jgi:hypothetical protein
MREVSEQFAMLPLQLNFCIRILLQLLCVTTVKKIQMQLLQMTLLQVLPNVILVNDNDNKNARQRKK